MKVLNINPNALISIQNIEEVNGATKVKFIDDRGMEREASLLIENEDKKRVPAKMKDWNNFQKMLEETAVPSAILQKLEIEFGKEIDEKIKSITARFATEPQNIPTLAAELGDLTARKSIIVAEMIEEEKQKMREEAKNRVNFFVGGIVNFENEKGVSSTIEIPQPGKARRNMRNISENDVIMDYSFKLNGKPLKISDLDGLDISKVRIQNSINSLNNKNVLDDIFEIVNNNTINGLATNKKEILLTKLINVYGKSEQAKDLNEFRETLTPETLTTENIEKLRELYKGVKEDILANGMKDYKLNVNVVYNEVEKGKLLDRMVQGLSGSLVSKLTGKSEIPSDVELTNIVAMHKFPRNVIDGVNKADQWYGAIQTSKDNVISNVYTVEETIKQVKIESFSSSTIENQIREIARKELELEKEKAAPESQEMDR